MAVAGRAIVPFEGDYSKLTSGLASALAPAKMGKMGKMGGLAVGGAFAAAIGGAAITKALYDVGSEFDSAFDKIRVGTGKTGKQLKGLERDLKAVYSTVPGSMDDVATAIAGLNERLDLTGKPLRRMARNVVELSRLTGTDLEGNIRGVSRAFVDWEVPVKKQVKTLNGFFRLAQKSGATVGDLTSDVQKFGSPLRTLGFGIGEAASMFATFEKAGVNAQTMVPGFKLAIGNLVKPTAELKTTLSNLGVAVGDPKKGLRQVMDLLGNKSNLSSVQKISLAMDVFGKRAGADMAEAIKQGRFNLKDYIQEFKNGNDTIKKSADDTNDAGENFKKFGHKLKVAVEPAATAVFDAITGISKVLASPKTDEALKNFKKIFNTTFGFVYRQILKPFVTLVRESFKAIRTIIQKVSGFVNGDVKDMWESVKAKFTNGVKVIKGKVNGIWGDIKGGVRAVKDGITSVFSSAWDKVESIFSAGASAVIGVVRSIIGVINKIPGVPDIPMPDIPKTPAQETFKGFQQGALITGGKPSGDSVPALLERGEYVLNREAVKKVGVQNLDHLNFKKAARFQTGGPIGMIDGGSITGAVSDAANAVAGAASNVLHPVDWFLNKLPKPNIPEPFTGVGPYVVDKAKDYIKDKVGDLIAAQSASSGNFNYTGPPADMRKLGDNAWVDTHTLAVGDYLAKRFNTYITDGWRQQDASYGAANSSHKRGTPDNPGALDFAAATTEFQSFVGSHVAGVTENLLNDSYSTGPHNHVAFFRKGGLIRRLRKMAMGGGVNINRKFRGAMYPSSSWSALPQMSFNVAAALAEAAGDWAGNNMPGVTFAQMSLGEGALRPGSMGDDNGDGSPDGYGWLAITRPYGDGYGVGNYEDMLNPVYNAAVAAKMWGQQGFGAWYGDSHVTGWNKHYDGPYDISKSLGGRSFADVIGGRFGGGSSKGMAGMSGGKGGGKPDLSKSRKKKRRSILDKLTEQVSSAKTTKGKQGALWHLIKSWAKYGDFDRDGASHLTDIAKRAAGTVNPLGNISTLKNLASWLDYNVAVSGEEDPNERLSKRLERVTEKAGKRAEKKRTKVTNRIAGRGTDYPLKGVLKSNDGIVASIAEQIDIAEQNASASSGPGGSDYTDAEVMGLVDKYRGQLAIQRDSKNKVLKSINYVSRVRDHFANLIKSTKPGTKAGWKLPAYRKGLTGAKQALSELTGRKEGLIGVTGKGGDIFSTELQLKELGVMPTLESSAASERDTELLSLMREQLGLANRNNAILSAQTPIYEQFLPKYHTGGIIPPGGEQPIMAKGGEGVFTPRQMEAMGGGSPTVVIEIAPGAGVDPAMIDARINGQLVKTVRRTRTGNAGAQKYNTAGLR